MEKSRTVILYFLLGFICFCALFYGIGTYPLLDVDETRYVNMARDMFNTKDFLTLYLNGEYFFEKPPLFFWIECLSFKLLGFSSEFSARLPIVLLSLLPAGLLLFLCRKVRDGIFAIITTLILFTSLEYMFLTKMAILDSVLTSFVTSSILCYFYTFFAKEENKKYFWALTYIFSAFATLAKGIPGFAIPMLIIIISSFVFKSYKETLRYSWGIFLFLLITLPWHIIMLKLYGSHFFDEYIIKHHILRFLGSEVINRTQPWYFYLITILWGVSPHIFVAVPKLHKIKEVKSCDKFLTLNIIATLVILVFFSLSGTKLITYILPIYPFLSVLICEIWYKYVNCGDKVTQYSLLGLNVFFVIAVVGLIFIRKFLPIEIYSNFQEIQIVGLLIFIPFTILSWYFWIKKKRLHIFLTVTILMSVISGFLTPYVYEFDYKFGQNDLMKFAQYAKDNKKTISAYLTGRKYSLLYYGNQQVVNFETDENLKWLQEELTKENNIVIIKNENIKNLPIRVKDKGVKFSIIEWSGNEE